MMFDRICLGTVTRLNRLLQYLHAALNALPLRARPRRDLEFALTEGRCRAPHEEVGWVEAV